MLEILMYILERFIINQPASIIVGEGDITEELKDVGFEPEEITQALRWLDDLESLHLLNHRKAIRGMRVYSPEEKLRLDPECLGFLLSLEQSGILDAVSREIVIDRALALNEPINVSRLKWVSLVVLSHYVGKEAELAWLENKVLSDASEVTH
ncbi:MAG: DUF494 domain-containing protein [Gammaproteobacteria bacterium]|nr:DUF494 domain-containing protein [Gammaproteobacteria bacterium]